MTVPAANTAARFNREHELQALLTEYAASHRHPINKLIHVVMVPLIYWSIVGMLWSVPLSSGGTAGQGSLWLNASWLVMLVSAIFYVRLSYRVTAFMLLFTAACMGSFALMSIAGWPVLIVSGVAFVVAWVFQFIGHVKEGKKPSFFKDVQFLMVGPAWVAHALLRR